MPGPMTKPPREASPRHEPSPARRTPPNPWLRALRSVVTVAALAAWAWLLFLRHRHRALRQDASAAIPNQVHLVKMVQDPASRADFAFCFTDFLAAYAAWHHWRPRAMYLHTNAGEAAVRDARAGLSGRWTERLLRIPGLAVVAADADAAADRVAVEAVRAAGGIALAFDVFALQDVGGYRRGRHEFVSYRLGEGGAAGHDFFMAARGSGVVEAWAERLRRRPGGEGASSPSELILREGSARTAGAAAQGVRLMDADEFVSDKRDGSVTGRLLETARGGPHEEKWTGERWEFLTPRHLLGRRSVFARAMYPVVRELVDAGVVDADEDEIR
ncbi:uncharacterized protein UV8b_05910 [Ustilaginoidea virens]|uniref:Glycosyl transferase n=1 Tax=Ustilaginoidea virens TaxID=1159556 RepID=A0A8E5MJI9_USTVR|nr:uncharacterized protein UV8b_05910 [Ustilaginoidea virens]QUC21667.1 hypothetical protein UV8b_05910 [Ustilaginoidea virens]